MGEGSFCCLPRIAKYSLFKPIYGVYEEKFEWMKDGDLVDTE